MPNKSKASPQHRTYARKRAQKPANNFWSWAVPVAVGVVVLAIIVGAIIINEDRQQANAAAATQVSSVLVTPTGLSVPVVTVAPVATEPVPYPDVERITLKDTQTRLNNGQAILIDVRSKENYDLGHAVGALSIPEEEIEGRLSELPRDKLLILYCT